MTIPIGARLESEGYRVRHVVPGSNGRTRHTDCYEVDCSSPGAVADLYNQLTANNNERVGWIINLLPLSRPFATARRCDAATVSHLAQSTFNIVKQFAPDLCASATEGGGRVVNITGLNGQFGLGGNRIGSLPGASTLGICRTLKREHPELDVKLVDVDPDIDATALMTGLLNELSIDGGPCEVGLTANGRWKIRLTEDDSIVSPLCSWPIDSNSVILVTGGAFGITAEVTKTLAAAKARLIIVGRSSLQEKEAEETRHLDEASLRSHLISQARANAQQILPAEIERSFVRIIKNRNIRKNLTSYREAGATVEYHAVDVRSGEKFGGLIDEIYRRWGKIDGVLHGAGIIHDKLIRDKTPETFAEVFGTKVESSLVLAEKLRPESLKFLVFFSSVSGRFGNIGQADYSAANGFMDKLAVHLDRQWPARVVSISWGPWDAGMVSEQLRQVYASRGIGLIPIPDGVRFFESELRRPTDGSAEVVISCSVDQIANAGVGE